MFCCYIGNDKKILFSTNVNQVGLELALSNPRLPEGPRAGATGRSHNDSGCRGCPFVLLTLRRVMQPITRGSPLTSPSPQGQGGPCVSMAPPGGRKGNCIWERAWLLNFIKRFSNITIHTCSDHEYSSLTLMYLKYILFIYLIEITCEYICSFHTFLSDHFRFSIYFSFNCGNYIFCQQCIHLFWFSDGLP